MSHFVGKGANVNAGTWRRISDMNSVPIFLNLIPPRGKLPDRIETHALWYFLINAHRELDRIERDVNYEIDGMTEQSDLMRRGQITHTYDEFRRLADMTARLYEVDLNDMFAAGLVNGVRVHCIRKALPIKDKLLCWIQAGGKLSALPEQGDHWFGKGE